MARKNLLVTLTIILVIISTSFIYRKTDVKPEYAHLLVSHYGFGNNDIIITYANGDQEDMVEKLDLKVKGYLNMQANFPEEVKVFNYLNQKGFVLVSHSDFTDNGFHSTSYIFIKGN